MTLTIRPGMRLNPGVTVKVPVPKPTYGLEFRTWNTTTSMPGNVIATCNEGDIIWFGAYGTNIPNAPTAYLQFSGANITSQDISSSTPILHPTGDAPFIITTTGADWPPANRTFTRDIGTSPPTWTNPIDPDTKITYNNSVWAIRNEAAFGDKNVYVTTGTLAAPGAQWALDPLSGLGNVPPTGSYTYKFDPYQYNVGQTVGHNISAGTNGFTIQVASDMLTEGNETLNAKWYIDANTEVASANITIADMVLVTSGLLYNYDASTYSGTGDWIDSVSGAHAVKTGAFDPGPTWSNGVFTLDRTKSQHFIAPWGSFRTTFTIDIWFTMDGNQQAEAVLIGDAFGGGQVMNFVICSPSNGNQLQCGWFPQNWAYGQNTFPQGGYNINGTTWYNLTMAVSSTGVVDYVNGTVNNSTQNPFNGITSPGGAGNTNEFRIGRGWSGYNFNGKVAVVNIYNRALNSTEVLQNFNYYKNRYIQP